MTIVLWFLFSLFLGFALHYIHAFHSRFFFFFLFFFLKSKQIMFCIYFLGIENKVGQFIYT